MRELRIDAVTTPSIPPPVDLPMSDMGRLPNPFSNQIGYYRGVRDHRTLSSAGKKHRHG
jgi:hypothetical protein